MNYGERQLCILRDQHGDTNPGGTGAIYGIFLNTRFVVKFFNTERTSKRQRRKICYSSPASSAKSVRIINQYIEQQA